MFVAGTVYTTPFGTAVCLSTDGNCGVFAHPGGGFVHAAHGTDYTVKPAPKALEAKGKTEPGLVK